MADHQAILEEEFEVLESIFPDELEKVSATQVRIVVQPVEEVSGHPLQLTLVVTYPPTYPDVIPELDLEEPDDEETGELRDGEAEVILGKLRAVAEESLGMAMTFTIATAASEALQELIEDRIKREQEEDDARAKAYEEEEAARTRGTPLTPELFNAWAKKFRAEVAAMRAKEEEERVRTLPAKEREEWRRRAARPSGRQLFETAKVSATSDEAFADEGATAVDVSKYSREERDRNRWEEGEEHGAGVDLVDSDDE